MERNFGGLGMRPEVKGINLCSIASAVTTPVHAVIFDYFYDTDFVVRTMHLLYKQAWNLLPHTVNTACVFKAYNCIAAI